MPYFEYASFPNSRNKNRAPTTKAITYQKSITSQNDAAPELTLIALANLNRTYVILENLDPSYDTYYFYVTTQVVDPTVVATFGVKNQKIWNPTSKILYNKNDDGTNTNWTAILPANLTTQGEKINPFQAATLESLEDVYAIGTQPLATPLLIGVDEGRG